MGRWLTTSRWPRLLALSLTVAVAGASLLYYSGHRLRIRKVLREAEKSWEEGEYQRAVELYQALVEENPDDPLASRAQFQVGSISYLFLLREREAIQAFRELIARDPGGEWSLRAQAMLGEIYEERLGDYRQAIVEYQRLINLSPGEEQADKAQLAVARCYFRLGDFAQAREEYELHLERHPDSPDRARAMMGVANCHYVRRAYQSAITYYRQVMQESSDPLLQAEAGYGIASSLEEAGELKAALEEFEALRASYPNPELILQRLERIRSRIEQKELP